MRLITDIFEFCAAETPKFNTISISGYHIREAGSTAAQEVAFTLGNGIQYVEAAVDAGLDVDDFAPQLSFFFNAHNNILEEVAKFRAARRMWAKIMEERFGAENPKSMQLKFHTQTGGSTLTAQQVENNVVRVAYQALAAVLGGTQSLHTNGKDEAIGLPTEQSVRTALRTQQILAHESGAADTIDPLAGSYYVESLTDELEAEARELIEEVDERGGMRRSIEEQWVQRQIQDVAFERQREQEAATASSSASTSTRSRKRASRTSKRSTRPSSRPSRTTWPPSGRSVTTRQSRRNLTRSGGPPRATRTSRPTSSTPAGVRHDRRGV